VINLLASVNFEKVALRLKVIHGTSQAFKKLLPWGKRGRPNFAGDPNPRALYAATKARRTRPAVEQYARNAVKLRGSGRPTVSTLVADTSKGWSPHAMSPRSQKFVGQELGKISPTIAEQREYWADMIRQGDWLKGQIKTNPASPRLGDWQSELGTIYKNLNQNIGAWKNPSAVKPIKHRFLGSANAGGNPFSAS